MSERFCEQPPLLVRPAVPLPPPASAAPPARIRRRRCAPRPEQRSTCPSSPECPLPSFSRNSESLESARWPPACGNRRTAASPRWPPGRSTGANPPRFSSATEAPPCPRKSSALPTHGSTFPWPPALSPSTPRPALRSSSTKPPAKETPFPDRTSNLWTLRVLREKREPLSQPPCPRRGPGHPRRQPPARRAHAPAHVGRIHRPGETSRPRQAAAHANRIRQRRLDAFLGTARLRQNPARAPHRPPHAGRIRLLQRRARRHQRNQGRHGRSGIQGAYRLSHHRLCRRSPSLQQSAAGRLPSPRRSGPHHVHRR